MDWLSCIKKTIENIENNLTKEMDIGKLAEDVFVSPFFLQRGFSLMTGYGIAEYARNRRLYLAALELQSTNEKVIDIALRYGYETPESFSKAFSRFHGATPTEVREGAPIKKFHPLKISISIQGGTEMEYKITKMFSFKVIGFERVFDNLDAQERIPRFWDEICERYARNVYAGNPPANALEKALMDNCIGEYGICIDDIGKDKFRYLIAGRYAGGEVPEGMTLYEFPMGEWAVFDCIGPIPEALQAMSNRIFKEWLPSNPDYTIAGNANVEWYDCVNGEKTDSNYHSAVWIPVKRK